MQCLGCGIAILRVSTVPVILSRAYIQYNLGPLEFTGLVTKSGQDLLTLKAPSKIAADDTLFLLLSFEGNKSGCFM